MREGQAMSLAPGLGTEHSTGRLAGRHGDTLATGNTQEVPNLGEMEHNGTFGCNKGL